MDTIHELTRIGANKNFREGPCGFVNCSSHLNCFKQQENDGVFIAHKAERKKL